MNKTIGLQLVVYSLLLAGLSSVTHVLAPDLARLTLIAGLVGGILCLVWGLWAVAGSPGKALPVLTLIPVTFILLSQTMMGWLRGSLETPGHRLAAAVMITVLFALSMAMMLRITYAGVVFDGQPVNPMKDGGAKPRTTGKSAA